VRTPGPSTLTKGKWKAQDEEASGFEPGEVVDPPAVHNKPRALKLVKPVAVAIVDEE
jgi:hypothetical protein